MHHLRNRQVRVGRQVLAGQHHMATWIAVAADKPAAHVVERQPKLAVAVDRLADAAARIKAEVPATDRNRFRLPRPYRTLGGHHASPESVGDVNAVVDGKGRMIGPQLRVFLLETRIPSLSTVGDSVAIGVDQVQQFSGDRHQYAPIPRLDAGGEQQPVGKHSRCLVSPVSIGVLEPADP